MSMEAEDLGNQEYLQGPYNLYWVDGLPVIVTQRLLLRIALVGEEPEIVGYLRRNREHLQPWEPKRDEHYFTNHAWVGAPERDQREAREGIAYRFRLLLKSPPNSKEYLGTVSLRHIEEFPMFNATIGYSLDHSFEGQGLMREAVAAVIRFGFEEKSLRRIEACFMPSNERSERLLTGLGFQTEGLLRSSLEVNGQWEDHHISSLINVNWQRP